MGTTNFGGQVLTFDYKNPATAQEFNRLNYQLHAPGIYNWQGKDSGSMPLSRVNDSTVTVSPMTFFITDSGSSVGVRVQTTVGQDITVSSTIPYIVWSFTWSNAEQWYADLSAKSFGNINAEDIVIGRCVFDGSTLSTEFDYTRMTTPTVATADSGTEASTTGDAFTVKSNEPVNAQVYVEGGVIRTKAGNLTVSSGLTGTFNSVPAGFSRIDLVWIDETGAKQIIHGDAAPSDPPVPEYEYRFVIAEIHRTAVDTDVSVVTGANIVDVRNRQRQDIYEISTELASTATGEGASLVGIEDANGRFSSAHVEGALQETGDVYLDGDNTFTGTNTFNGTNEFTDQVMLSGSAEITAGTVIRGYGMTVGALIAIQPNMWRIVQSSLDIGIRGITAGPNGVVMVTTVEWVVANQNAIWVSKDYGKTMTKNHAQTTVSNLWCIDNGIVTGIGQVYVAGDGDGRVWVSTDDGDTWTNSFTKPDGRPIYGIGVSPDAVVAAGNASTGGSIYTTDDPVNGSWIETLTLTDSARLVSYLNGQFFVATQTDEIYASADGYSWTSVASFSLTPKDVTYASDKYFTVVVDSTNGTHQIWASEDTTTWSQVGGTFGSYPEMLVGYSGILFKPNTLVGADTEEQRLWYSIDGEKWTEVFSIFGTNRRLDGIAVSPDGVLYAAGSSYLYRAGA